MSKPKHSISSSNSNVSVWWSNGFLFVAVHVAALVGVSYHPWHQTHRATLLLAFIAWQAACFGITIGYHRMYSHKAFKAKPIVKLALAFLGASAFQGSIRWWCLRHRLHHRYTDDPVHDPYSASRGLLWSHMGWIFFKPTYERMHLIDKDDLDRDSVVRWQHRNYIPLALLSGFVLPTIIGCAWGDAMGAFIYAGLVARVLVWHCTFLVNSLAHWDGLQPYTDENTSRTNLLIALLTCGEGNHNFHAFPQDYRSGPSRLDWDPSKWIISLLHRIGLITGLRRARHEDLASALLFMHHKHTSSSEESSEAEDSDGEPVTSLSSEELRALLRRNPQQCIILIGPYIVDATNYLAEHPGGAGLLRRYALKKDWSLTEMRDASERTEWAFEGGMNAHSRVAKLRRRQLTLGKLLEL